ncbi:MAG TPA: hypothetical protein QGH10_10095 [Armatimonadota bacterium]|nr:hypothetical protein [Armatimonadota bacterium]
MAGLLYREDMDAARERLTEWWNGGDIGRPVILLSAPRDKPIEDIPALAEPEGWTGQYSTVDYGYRVNLAARQCIHYHYLGEATPFVSPDLAPNCLALYMGCQGVEMPDTVWCEPFMDDPDEARFDLDPDNFYWQFSTRLGAEEVEMGKDKFLVQFPDLIEGLDTLAAMRGTDNLLLDVIERPDWVQDCLRQITDRYFYCYDILYDMFRDEVGGTHFWAWAPGRMAKFQCDFSAMIGPDMFGEFMVPVLNEMCDRVGYSMYHWDGPGAIAHHDHLLSIPGLDMLQWTPGAGVEAADHEKWWPLYHKTVDAGKKVHAGYVPSVERLEELKREFGPKLKQFLFNMGAPDPKHGEEILRAAEV